MRRFWAHIVIVLTAIFMMGASFFTFFTNVSTNMEYKQGREITFRLTDKDNPDEEIVGTEGVETIAKEMKNRLDTVGVTSYNINTVGNDIIKVQLAEPSNANINNIIVYLGFNSSLALSNMDDDDNYKDVLAADFLNPNAPAYIESLNGYPTIVIPVNKNSQEFLELIEKTKTQQEEGVGEQTSTGEKDEQGNDKTTTTTYLYLWYDFNPDTDSYSRTQQGKDGYDVNIANKIMMKFDITNLYYPDGQENKIATSINMDANDDKMVTITEVRDAYNRARLYVNLLNSSELDYKVTFINDATAPVPVAATSENLINLSDPHKYVALSRTLIATICATLIVSLLLAVFFKLTTTSIVTTTLVSLFASTGLIIAFGAEFNIAALIGLIAVSFATLASGILYGTKLKEEAYKGRALKKANSEAAKKALLPTVDIHVALILIGALTYAFGGTLMRTFAMVSVIGGLISLVLSLLGLRGLMWLLTNNTAFVGKYSLFAIDPNKVVDTTKEEKGETFKGMYADKDFSKRHKPIGLITLGLFVASLVGLITFGALNNGQPFASASTKEVSQVYVYYTSTDDLDYVTITDLKNDLLDKVLVYSSSSDTEGKLLSTYVKDETEYSHSETVDSVKTTTTYFEFTLKSVLNEDSEALALFDDGSQREALSLTLQRYSTEHNKVQATVKVSGIHLSNEANFNGIIIGSVIATAILSVYFILRYRLSRGLTSLFAPFVTTAISVGLFVLTRIAFPTVTPVVIPLIALFTVILTVYIMNKDRELYLEDKAKALGYEARSNIMKQAVSVSFEEILIFAIIASYIGINFFGFGPTANSLIFILSTVGFIISATIITSQFAPVSDFLYRRLAKIENKRPNKKVKKEKKVINQNQHKSREPEEAIFIGIND